MAIKGELLILLVIGISACATSYDWIYTNVRCSNMPQCRCNYYSSDPTYLECSQRNPPMTIQDYIKIFQENNVSAKKDIIMIFNGLAANSRIPSRIFEGFDIVNLAISYNDNTITTWADEEGGPAFVGLENTLERFKSFSGLSVPRKYDNYQQEKAPMSLGHLRKLREVEFTYNDINTFANGWFDKGPSSLEKLKLKLCETRYFGDRAFAGLTNLKEIDLSSNQFESLSRSMFPNPANHLKKMDFTGNKIKDLPDDFFTNMPALREVYLVYNRITHIPETVWRPVWSQLSLLYFTSNDLNCDDHIHWMFKVKPPSHMWGLCDTPKDMYNVELGQYIKSKQGRY